MPHIVVLLPGITGSVLARGGKEVWAASGSAVVRGLLSGAQSIRDLALHGDSLEDDLGDGVVATRLMPDVHLLPGLWKIDGYGKIRDTIMATFDVTEGRNYFEFAYDWRRDNRVAARQFQRRSHEWLSRWRETSGRHDARLVLIAHSMGGLVARYFLEALDGWRETRALVTFGTPYRGSVDALGTLANGMRMGPFGAIDLSALVRSFTATYQLLPTYEVYDAGDGTLRRVGETSGIPNVDAARAAAALAFHHEIRVAVEAHRQDAAYREGGYRTFPIVGIEQPTLQSAQRAGGGVACFTTRAGDDLRGDGTVPRASATPLEQSSDPRDMYAATRHASLQNADAVLTHLSGVLQSLDLDLGAFRAAVGRKARLSLDIHDAYAAGEPVSVRVQPDHPNLKIVARVASADTGRTVARAQLAPRDDGWHQAEVRPLKPGVYRLTVSAGARAEPAADIFAVFGPPAG
jgi:hypothetical protein